MQQIRISAKNLGKLALEDFCPRCFWIDLHAKKLPWQIFPGIFSSIDAYTKKTAHAWIDTKVKNGFVPLFLEDLGVTGYGKALHWSKSKVDIPEFGIILVGGADDLWLIGDKGIHIPDYKTARYTKNQDKLIPMHKVQLNGYAKIYDALGENVTGLSMIYMEPVTDEMAAVGGAGPGFLRCSLTPNSYPSKWI